MCSGALRRALEGAQKIKQDLRANCNELRASCPSATHGAPPPFAATCSLHLSNPISQLPADVAVLLAVTKLEVALLLVASHCVVNTTTSTSPPHLSCLDRTCCAAFAATAVLLSLPQQYHQATTGERSWHVNVECSTFWQRVGVRLGNTPRREPALRGCLSYCLSYSHKYQHIYIYIPACCDCRTQQLLLAATASRNHSWPEEMARPAVLLNGGEFAFVLVVVQATLYRMCSVPRP